MKTIEYITEKRFQLIASKSFISLFISFAVILLLFVTFSASNTELSEFGILILIMLIFISIFLFYSIRETLFSFCGAYKISYDQDFLVICKQIEKFSYQKKYQWNSNKEIGIYSHFFNLEAIVIEPNRGQLFTFGFELSIKDRSELVKKLSDLNKQKY